MKLSVLIVGAMLAAGSWTPPPALPDPSGARAIAHDLHLTSATAAVEDNVVLTRVRFFTDDLEAALRLAGAPPDFLMSNSPQADSLFLAYVEERYVITVAGQRLTPVIVAKGQDELDREPVWWYAVQHEASEPVGDFRARNTLLLELFADQRNVVKFVRFPDETQRTYSFGHGDEEFDVRF